MSDVIRKLIATIPDSAPADAEVWLGGWSTYSGVKDAEKVHVGELRQLITTDTTPTPAQADEKAPDPITRPIVGIEHRTAQEVFEIMVERVRRAAPEAVAEPAYPELDDGYQWVRNIRASPPAPAGVKVRPLEWLECKALSGFTKLIGRDCFGNEFVRLDIRNQTRAEIDEFKRAQQADYEARILSAILPPEEAQAGSPAEALPSQTSGAEAPETKGPYEPRICKGMPTDCCDYGVVSLSAGREVCRVWREQDARAIAAALAKPVSEPAGGGGYISADNGQGMGVPTRCVRYHCQGEIIDNGSDNTCQKCGASYGRD